jgi:hypothetical protein
MTVCLVEDPVTRTYRPRNYVEGLEKRVAFLENLLKQCRPDLTNSDLIKHHGPPPENVPNSSSSTQQYIEIVDHQRDYQSASSRAKDDSIQENDDGVEKLASKVGLLSLSAAGAEPQYLGSSSIFAFSRLINSTLRQVVSPDLATRSTLDTTEERSSLLPSPCLLPDYFTAVQLSNVYFQNVNTHYPFLHEATFREWESMLMDESAGLETCPPSSLSLFFLNMVRFQTSSFIVKKNPSSS